MKVNTLDRYEILGELGRGAISIVYEARDLITDDPVTLKLIEPSLWAPPTLAAEPLRFLIEAMPEWRLRHPNIVRVYDAGDSDGRLYIAMERLEGRTLRRVLDESPLPGLLRSLRMAAELASGLAHAHERGVVHCYLKPSNIFVFADDRAKIAEFGVAPLQDVALGSPDHAACLSYMSPEAIRCDAAIDGRSDIFSLGVVLYEMVTGERPFGGDSPGEIMRKVLEAELPLLSEVTAGVPPMVDLLVWSMLAKNRFDRAPSAEILARRLRRLGEELDGVLTTPAREYGASGVAATTDERASDDRSVVMMPAHLGDDRALSAEILASCVWSLGEEVEGVLTAPAREDGESGVTATTDERAPSREILVHEELGEELDGVLTTPAREEEASGAEGAADEYALDDRNVVFMPAHSGDDPAPSAEIHVSAELGEALNGVLTTPAREEGASGVAGAADERASDDRSGVLMPAHLDDDRAPSPKILAHEELGEALHGVLTAPAREEQASGVAGAADERASDDRSGVLMPPHLDDDHGPSPEILAHEELNEALDGVLTAPARDEGASGAAGATEEHACNDRNIVLMPAHRIDDRAPSAEIHVHGELGEALDGVLTTLAREEGASGVAGTADGYALDDRNVVLMSAHRGDDPAPNAEIHVHGELGEALDGVLTAPAREEGASSVAGAADGYALDDRNVVLMPTHRGDDRAPSTDIHVHRELGEALDGALTTPAREEGEPAAAAATAERAPSAEIVIHGELGEELDGVLTTSAREERASSAAGATDEPASDDRNVVLMPAHRGDDPAPSAEILLPGELGEALDGVLTAPACEEEASGAAVATDDRASDDLSVVLMPPHRGDDRAPSPEILVPGKLGEEVEGVFTAPAREEEASGAAVATDDRASDDLSVVPMLAHRGAPQRTKLRLPTFALAILILVVAGSGFLWQWRQPLGLSEADSATSGEAPATAITFEPSIPDDPRLSASAPEPTNAASAPEPTNAASAPEPTKAASEPEPKKRASKAPARKLSRSAIASAGATKQEIEPPVVALATEPEPASAPVPPPVKTATLVFDVSPWGEIYVDGKLHGTTPPIKTLDLPAGMHRIELRNSAQPPSLIYTTLERGDVRRIRHRFE